MDSELRKLIDSLPNEDVGRRELKKFRKILPIPTDHEVLWIHIISKGGHPAAYVITDRAFIYKASKADVKSNNKELKKNKIKYIYQIVPWEYYSPELIQFIDEAKRSFSFDGERVVTLDERTLADFFSSYNDIIFAQRRAFIDSRVQDTSSENTEDDAIIGYQIKCHYCCSANKTVDDCFDKNGVFVGNANTMRIEVPFDQYDDVKKLFYQKIQENKVPEVSDPQFSEKLIRKGILTYSQAKSLARIGKIDSLKYGGINGSVRCTSALGVSSVASYAFSFWSENNVEEAVKNAVRTGVQVYGKCFSPSVLATRGEMVSSKGSTGLFSMFTSKKPVPVSNETVKTPVRFKPLENYGVQYSYAPVFTAGFFDPLITYGLFSVPQAYKLITRKISGAQFVKNMFTLSASYAGTMAGSKLGEQGSKLSSVGATAGGLAAGVLARAIGNHFREDDAVIMSRMINEYVSIHMIDNMLTEREQDVFIEGINLDTKGMEKLIPRLNKSKYQERDIDAFLFPKIKRATASRKRIKAKQEDSLISGLDHCFQKLISE